ncbi:MAG: 50S ribosomal protein L15 [Patescibacteria group bacterium]|jgi:large subunit ribosomal protein L15|nr:50S ribosomal protein L15 [Patescibacteria group bacterium]
MAISLHNIKRSSGSSRPGKRLGRGDSSGKGTYSGRGLKGQKSRSGVSRTKLKRLGMKSVLLKTPKSRGFKSLSPKNQVVSVVKINENFKDNEVVNAETLLAKKLIRNKNLPIKILGKEALIPKGLKFEKILFSQSVKDQLEKK